MSEKKFGGEIKREFVRPTAEQIRGRAADIFNLRREFGEQAYLVRKRQVEKFLAAINLAVDRAGLTSQDERDRMNNYFDWDEEDYERLLQLLEEMETKEK